MNAFINFLIVADVMLAILLVVVQMALMDQGYAAKVRAETKRKSILRGEDHDDWRF